MRAKTCCFTGHRDLSKNELPALTVKLENVLISLIENGYLYFGAGGARGFDTLAAQTILRLRARYPSIKLILVLPCLSQADFWPAAEQAIYREILTQADKVVYTSEEYTKGCMYKRNRHLVDNSSVCVCYLRKTTGGTAYTVAYAQQRGLHVINLAKI